MHVKTNQKSATVVLNFPSMEMLKAGAAALPGTPLARIEAVWMAMCAAAPSVATKSAARTNDAAKSVQLQDTERLDCLSEMAGFVGGMADGAMAYRILMRNRWHPTLRAAIDEVITETTKKNPKLKEEKS